jgi:hypothetical protein
MALSYKDEGEYEVPKTGSAWPRLWLMADG